jgi:polysaccharide biosynthesis protein PslH
MTSPRFPEPTASAVTPATSSRLRIRFVSTRPAWPLYPGYRLRTANLLRSLCAIADVDAIFVMPSDEKGDVCAPTLTPRSVRVVPVPRLSAAAAVLRWVRGRLPMPMTKVDWADAARAIEPLLHPNDCDLVFVTPSTAWHTVRNAGVPIIADLDDLDDYKIRHRLADRANYPSGAKGFAERVIDRRDLRRWERLYAEVKATAKCVVVCSSTDIARLGVPHARALPNVYPTPDTMPAPMEGREHASALFVGDLTYRPNLEALLFLENSVMARVWESEPDFVLHVVGRNDFSSRRFDPRIVVHGSVESVTPYLERTQMVVAPLRSGGGTRIKILEAFAHHIPVVSTTVGCEGIAASDGEHLLVADAPAAFADAMLKLGRDPELGRKLTGNAYELFRSNYTFESLSRSVSEVLTFAVQPGGNSSSTDR